MMIILTFVEVIMKLLLSLFLMLSFNAFAQPLNLVRTDGSSIRVYIETPNQKSFPLVVLVHGSTCNSAYPLFQNTSSLLLKAGIAVATIEKYGIDEFQTSCPNSYLENNTIQGRVLDHLQVIAHFRKNLQGWNHKVGWVGGSEGGQVASLVAPLVSETSALVMLASGGGMTMAEELPIVIERSMKKNGASTLDIQHELNALFKKYDEIKTNPVSTLEWLSDGNTARNTYKWWNSILWIKSLPLLETLSIPVFIGHGTEDSSCPYESSKIIAEKFSILGKTNLTFKTYPGLEHNWTDQSGASHMQEVLGEAMYWLVNYI
jgi:dienelactone hydrolase